MNHHNDSSADNRPVPNTPAYRRTLKKMVERSRSFLLMSGLDTRIPRGLQGKPMPESSEKTRKQFEEAKKRTFTVRTLHYFAHPLSNDRGASAPKSVSEIEAVSTVATV